MPDGHRERQYRAIRELVARHGLQGEALTASDVYELVRQEGLGLSSAHEVATVLGQFGDEPGLEIEDGSPYRYRFRER